MLGVSRSGYHEWSEPAPSPRALRDVEITKDIVRLHEGSRRTYGAPRIHAELCYEGTRCSRKRVARLIRRACIQGVPSRRRRGLTRRRPGAAPQPDRVERTFMVPRRDRLWVGDITYIPTGEG